MSYYNSLDDTEIRVMKRIKKTAENCQSSYVDPKACLLIENYV